jgi:hypothetical protein
MTKTASYVSLSIPCDPRYAGVVGLVVAGIAARFEVGLDRVDDLRLALEAAAFDGPQDSELEVEIRTDEGLVLQAGPVSGSVRERLRVETGPLALRQVLGSLVDEADVFERDGGDWLILKQQPSAVA